MYFDASVIAKLSEGQVKNVRACPAPTAAVAAAEAIKRHTEPSSASELAKTKEVLQDFEKEYMSKQHDDKKLLPPLPPFANYTSDGKALFIDARRMADPLLRKIYLEYSTAFRVSSVAIAPFLLDTPFGSGNGSSQSLDKDLKVFGQGVIDERLDAIREMACGWFASCYVYTPLLYALLQGPLEGARTEHERGCAQWSSISSTHHLNRYYRAVQLMLVDSYAQQAPGDPIVAKRIAKALQQSREARELLSQRMRNALFECMSRVFADQQPAPHRITREVQLSKPTTEWVELYRRDLGLLAQQLRMLTLLRLQLAEAMICELLGVPGDESTCALFRLQLAVPSSTQLIGDAQRKSLAESAISSYRFLADSYLAFPRMKVDGSGLTTHFAEGMHLKYLIVEGTLADDIRNPKLNASGSDGGGDPAMSLALLWVRLCTYTRLLDAQREYEEEKRLAKLTESRSKAQQQQRQGQDASEKKS